ncbi:MAG TPA: hypothetical protein VG267_16370 [Terracidiphilus sp.]|jgi:hypothetical protein|nr:hypothetical protein [Terracidiphilus sp.]
MRLRGSQYICGKAAIGLRLMAILWRCRILAAGLLVASFFHGQARAEAASGRTQAVPCETRHAMNDAWFTGPMLANTAATAPRGHSLIETYLYDVTTQGSYGANGKRRSAPHANSYGSLTYLIYGVTDKVALGVIPTAGYNTVSNGASSAGPGPGDLTWQIQRRVAQFRPCKWVPTISVAVQQTMPTGRYDRLGSRPSDGLGAGAWTTNPEILSQMYFWLPNRRILRARLNVSDAFSGSVNLQDASVYGTANGFRGSAKPGSAFSVDASLEYSATRKWVLAMDATYRNTGNTRVSGGYASGPGSGPGASSEVTNSGWSDAVGLSPAIEYSWKPTIGVLLGVRLIPAGHNTTETITPAIAINFVH